MALLAETVDWLSMFKGIEGGCLIQHRLNRRW